MYTLDFRITGADGRPLQSVADAIQQISARTKIGGNDLRSLEGVMNSLGRSGRTLRESLQDVSQMTGLFSKSVRTAAGDLLNEAKASDQAAQAIRRSADEHERAASKIQTAFARMGGRVAGSALPVPGGGMIGGQLFGGLASSGFAAGAGIAAAVASLSLGLTKLANETGQYAREQENLASRTGLSTQETQLFSQMAQATGVNVNALTTMMRTLSKGMAENTAEGKQARQALRELGLDASVAFEPMGKALPQILQKLGEVPDAVNRDRLAIEAFGRGGLELLPLVDQFNKLAPAIRALGGIMDQDGIQKAVEYQREIELLTLRWQALKRELGSKAIGVVEFVINGPFPWNNHGWQDVQNRSGLGVDQIGGLGAPRPQFPDPFAIMRQQQSARIQSILRSGEGRVGRQEAIQFDLQEALAERAAAVNREDEKGVKAANDKVIALREQLKALEKMTELQRFLETTASHFAGTDTSALRRLSIQYSDDVRRARQLGASPAQLRQITAGYSGAFLRETNTFNAKTSDEQVKQSELASRIQDDLIRQSLTEAHQQIGLPGSFLSTILEAPGAGAPPGPSGADRIRALQSQGQFATRMLPIQSQLAGRSGINAELDVARQILAIRGQILEQEKQAAIESIKATADETDRDRMIYDKKVEYEEKLNEIRQEYAEKQAQLELQRLDQFKSIFSGLVISAQGGPNQLRSFLKGQGTRLEETVLGNLAGIIYPSVSGVLGGTSLSPNSFAGRLLAGTPFGPKAGDPVSVATLNTDKQTLRTAIATEGIFKALTGQTVPGPGATSVGSTISLSPLGPGWAGIPIPGLNTNGGAFESGIAGVTGISSTIGKALGLPSISGVLGGVLGGVANIGRINPITGGGPGLQPGTFTASARVGAAVGDVAAGLGVYQGISSIARGGGGNIAAGVGETLMSIAPFTGPAAPFVAAAGAAASLISSFFGDPKQIRANQISKSIFTNQYLAPQAQNLTIGTNGGYADVDQYGNVRTSNLNPYPIVSNSYLDVPRRVVVPGHQISPFGGFTNATGAQVPQPIVIHVNALDSKSLIDRAPDVAAAVHRAIQSGHEPLVHTLGQQLGIR